MELKECNWYLAEIILEHIIEDDPRNVVHINIHLIQADSAEEAYEKSVNLGRQSEMKYVNTDRKEVRVLFRGLRQLTVIEDPLEDGAELIFEVEFAVAEENLRHWVRAKERLNVFSSSAPDPDTPNYMPKNVWDALLLAGKTEDERNNDQG